jgi:hypothetical protein
VSQRALGLALTAFVAACSFDTAPVSSERDRVAMIPVTESTAHGGWIDSIDREPVTSAVPTPNGRADDPLRPQQPGDSMPLPAAPLALPEFRKVSTQHLGQWTARPPNRIDGLGFSGTDLGVSFAHRGQLYFLFGDSQSVFDYAADSLALAAMDPLDSRALPRLGWVTRPSGVFAPLSVPGVDLGFMNVAVEGVSLGETVYLFVATGWSGELGHHSQSVLAHSDPTQLDRFHVDHAVSSTRFLNVSAIVDGPYVYIWGTGQFRKSDIYLARVRAEAISDRNAWEYFSGSTAEGPTFMPGEDNARPVVSSGCAGELSARKHPQLGVYLLAYNCEWPRGVFLHTARTPAGPYSTPITLFDPWYDAGYEHFIHLSPLFSGRDDGLSDPGREDESGGEYGPYLVPEWFSEEPDGGHGIVYTLSSWNPYQVHLMKTVIAGASVPAAPPAAPDLTSLFTTPALGLDTAMYDENAWTREGDGAGMFVANDGTVIVASDAAPLGAAASGTFWHDFRVDSKVSSLTFEVQGTDAEVLLVADDEVVRRVRARDASSWKAVMFQLASLRDRALRLTLYDRSSEGYVRLRNLKLR